jgi:hypothetical protein
MKRLELIRYAYSDTAVMGKLFIPGLSPIITGERPWQDNRKDVSCIPWGRYVMKANNCQTHGRTWRLVEVTGRTMIEFHTMNDPYTESQGCIGVGLRAEGYRLIDSRNAMELMRSVLLDHEYELHIKMISPEA